MIIEIIISAIFQLILFSAVPFLWWLFSARKKENFLSWLGLKKPVFTRPAKTIILMILSFALLFIPALFLIYSFEDKSALANAKFEGTGLEGAVAIMIYAIIQTGLSEEILFRGFLNKRLSNKFGFAFGNTVQAVLFGMVHGLLLFNVVEISTVILLVIFTSVVGWLLGYLNEKSGNGSIIPSWIIHSSANIIPSFMFLFGGFK
jgi:membrane protease YdiL (CAAX protease family)